MNAHYMTHPFALAALVILSSASTNILKADEKTKPVSGIHYAEKLEVIPHFRASGIAWWNDRLIIATRSATQLYSFTPPNKHGVLKEDTYPVGIAVDHEGRLLYTEKSKNLNRLIRRTMDGKEEVLLSGEEFDPGKGIGTPHYVAVHPNGTIYWSGFPGGGTRYLMPGAKEVTIAAPFVQHSHGIGLSPKHDWLYVNSKIPNADGRGVWRFPVNKDGSLGKGTFFIAIEKFTTTHLKDMPPAKDGSDKLLGWVGRLQGLAVDRLGYIYVSGSESHSSGTGIAVFTPDGKTIAAMIVPDPKVGMGLPTNVCGLGFGGKDGRTLFITGSGNYRLYQVRLPVAGEIVSRGK